MTEGYTSTRVQRILDAVETMEESLGVLASKRSLDRNTYHSDRASRDVVERRFVKLTEAALDIGNELCKAERGTPAQSNPKTMQTLGELGVLQAETADDMASAARFRNVLAHTYGDAIDHDMVYDALQDLERYRTFLEEVRDHLQSSGALDR